MVFDWFILRLPGWGRKIRRLRRDWDRAREKALTRKGPLKKELLERLDRIEDTLRVLEERRVTRIERGRSAKAIEIDLAGIKGLLEEKEEQLAEGYRETMGPVQKKKRFRFF